MKSDVTTVALQKVHAWRVSCPCGGHVDIASGAISGVETARCSTCKKNLPLNDILPVLKAARKLCSNHKITSDLSLLILSDRCDS